MLLLDGRGAVVFLDAEPCDGVDLGGETSAGSGELLAGLAFGGPGAGQGLRLALLPLGQGPQNLLVVRRLLGGDVPVRVDSARNHVFVGSPPVLLVAHRHGDAVYVPVKLFARQFGAYTDIGCTLANCGHIWPRDIIEYMRRTGAVGGTGMLEGHAEGIVRNIDVTKLPTG